MSSRSSSLSLYIYELFGEVAAVSHADRFVWDGLAALGRNSRFSGIYTAFAFNYAAYCSRSRSYESVAGGRVSIAPSFNLFLSIKVPPSLTWARRTRRYAFITHMLITETYREMHNENQGNVQDLLELSPDTWLSSIAVNSYEEGVTGASTRCSSAATASQHGNNLNLICTSTK